MSKHKCIIGIYYDYENTRDVTLTDLKDIAKENEERYKYLKEDNAFYGIIAKPYRLQDYLDQRKHLINHYTYCPICGKKIDWAKLRKENK